MKRNRKLTPTKALDFLNNNEKSVRQTYAIKAMAVSNYIENFVESNNYKQKEIADKLEMAESQLSKWLSGDHNLTLQSILKLESASSIEILNPAIWKDTSLDNGSINSTSDSKGGPVSVLKVAYSTKPGLETRLWTSVKGISERKLTPITLKSKVA